MREKRSPKNQDVRGGVGRQLSGLRRLRERLDLPDAQLRGRRCHRAHRPLRGLLPRLSRRGRRQGGRGRAGGPTRILQVNNFLFS